MVGASPSVRHCRKSTRKSAFLHVNIAIYAVRKQNIRLLKEKRSIGVQSVEKPRTFAAENQRGQKPIEAWKLSEDNRNVLFNYLIFLQK